MGVALMCFAAFLAGMAAWRVFFPRRWAAWYRRHGDLSAPDLIERYRRWSVPALLAGAACCWALSLAI